jgi:hypothetical protein
MTDPIDPIDPIDPMRLAAADTAANAAAYAGRHTYALGFEAGYAAGLKAKESLPPRTLRVGDLVRIVRQPNGYWVDKWGVVGDVGRIRYLTNRGTADVTGIGDGGSWAIDLECLELVKEGES